MARSIMLTTTDNPYDPFTEWNQWLNWDHEHGYNSTEALARLAHTSPDLTDEENDFIIENTIDEMCRINIVGRWKKVVKEE